MVIRQTPAPTRLKSALLASLALHGLLLLWPKAGQQQIVAPMALQLAMAPAHAAPAASPSQGARPPEIQPAQTRPGRIEPAQPSRSDPPPVTESPFTTPVSPLPVAVNTPSEATSNSPTPSQPEASGPDIGNDTPIPTIAPVAVAEQAPFYQLGSRENPRPPYPLIARQRKEEGTVRIWAKISADGRVIESKIVQSSGFAALDQAALDTVRRHWVFSPARRGQEAIEGEALIPIGFKLTD